MRGITLLLALLLAACNAPVVPNSMDDYYDTRTTGGVRGTLLGPQGLPSTVIIQTP